MLIKKTKCNDAKSPIRISTANDCVNYLESKFDTETYSNPTYHLSEVMKTSLQEEREKRRYLTYKRVKGSDDFHVIVFRPHQNSFHASPKLCLCNFCMSYTFESCCNFKEYFPVVHNSSKKLVRSSSIINTINNCASMVTANTVYAIYADSTIVDYFLLICERELEVYSVDGKPDYDDAGNELEDKSSYVYGKFLELSNFNTKHHEYRITKKLLQHTLRKYSIPKCRRCYQMEKTFELQTISSYSYKLTVHDT